MKNFFKKLPLMFFSVILVISTNVICAMAQNIESEYEEALNMLRTLGVISENVDYDPEALVSREDFAVYTANLLGLEKDNTDSRYFVDVPSGSYGTWAINKLTVMNVFSRNSENLFYPEENVDLNQVYKVLTTVLGYDMYAEANGGYPMGYRSAAIEADINLGDRTEANFKNIMVLLYRTAQAQIYERVVTGNTFEYSKNGETILSKYHDIYFDEGTVESICGMTVLRDDYVDNDSVRINGNVYDLKANIFTPDYLGRYVKYFYTDNDEELSVKIIFTVADEEEIKLLIDDVEDISSERLVYSDNKGREESENLDGVLWVYNGTPLGSNLSQTLAGLNKGSVTLADSDDDGNYDCVIIWDYTNFVVSGINSDDSVVYNKLKSGGKLSIEEFNAVNIFDEKGNLLTFDDISVENVLSVATSNDGKILNIIVSTTEFNGTLSQITDEETILINGTEYTVEPSYIDEFKDKKILIGYVYNYKTDAFGNIAYVYDGASGNPMKFGYVLKGIMADTDEGGKVRLEVLTQDEGVKKVFLTDKVKVDGARYKDIKELFEAFPNVEKGEIKPQMIRYEADSEGNIKTVDTLNLNNIYETKDNSLTVVGEDNFSLKWYMKNRVGMLAYVNNTHTNVYAIPQKSVWDEPDSSEYKVGTVNSMLRDDRAIYANIYTASGRSEYADVLVRQYQYSELIKDNEVILVDKITTVANDEGEVVKQISGLSQGSEVAINIPDEVDCKDIGTGDLIQLRYGINDQVVPSINDSDSDIIVLYDYSKYKGGMPLVEDWPGVSDTVTLYALVNNAYYHNYRAETQLSYGTVIAKEGNSIWWSYKNDETEDEMFNIASIPVMVYDSTERVGRQIYKGTIDDIEDFETVGGGSKIILQTNVGIGKGVFVFK